ncbi:hypothetical protein [Nakamurella lactea]|uniref:hypothetical protein n=1 Tax=Nakamurella lactea TaxID=459515 RepID=UPI0003FE7560|nr:hypothetical protein [Nakamurella lactea]
MTNKLGMTVVGMIAAALIAVPGAAAATTSAVPPAASPAVAAHGGHGCAAKFDEAQRADMESFRDFDAKTWKAGHDRNAVSIYPSGARFAGIDAIMAAQKSHFANKEAVWSWTEINRRVDGCRTAFIEYEAIYQIPRIGFYQRALTVVTYIYERGAWKSIMDQGTMLELRTG